MIVTALTVTTKPNVIKVKAQYKPMELKWLQLIPVSVAIEAPLLFPAP